MIDFAIDRMLGLSKEIESNFMECMSLEQSVNSVHSLGEGGQDILAEKYSDFIHTVSGFIGTIETTLINAKNGLIVVANAADQIQNQLAKSLEDAQN